MKSIEYYTGGYFDPRCGNEITADIWLVKKINAARQTIKELQREPIETRDMNRITDILKAVSHWEHLYDEIFGREVEK